jgi:hypothetical protein
MGVRERSSTDLLRGLALIGGEPLVARLKTAAHPEAPMPDWLERAIGEPVEPSTAADGLMPGSLQVSPP